MIEKAAGIKFKYVSYDGLAPRMNAILGGHIDLTDSNLTQKGKVEAGQLKFLAIASEKRDPEMPDVPTLKELGINIVYEVVRGLLVPKGTPAPVRAKLEEACAKAQPEPEFAAADEAAGHPRGLPQRQGLRRLPRQDRRGEQDHHDRPRADEEMRLGRDGIAGLIGLAISLGLLPFSRSACRSCRSCRSGRASIRRIVLVFMAVDERAAGAAGRRGAARAAAAAVDAGDAPQRAYGLVLAAFVDRRRLRRAAAAARLSHRHRAVRRPRSRSRWSGRRRCANGRSSLTIAVGTSAVTYFVFDRYLSVLLPRGRWTDW